MILSMTGFARVERQTPAGQLAWEIRSVNHRYLDLQLRLPEELRALEPDLRDAVRETLHRGKVEAMLRFAPATAGASFNVDSERLVALERALRSVEEVVDTRAATTLDVLKWPGVLHDQAVDLAPVRATAMALFDEALDAFQQTRAREGTRLDGFLTQRLDAMEQLVAEVKARAPQVQDAWLHRLQARLAELGVEADPARLAQEAVISAQRLDVAEELSRLSGHIKEVRAVLKRDEAVGRRLDFLMQELNREANTLSSKSQDEDMTRHAVDLKVLIEQLREQVQNVE
ncbi:MAG: YicC family protein [Nevskiaceae bacterium]|nr:MAG: YicC family protein [Nevskiaceae bacterium]TBR75128.1 MAG: YicC family protein [Nevskiaceae bacterium]